MNWVFKSQHKSSVQQFQLLCWEKIFVPVQQLGQVVMITLFSFVSSQFSTYVVSWQFY